MSEMSSYPLTQLSDMWLFLWKKNHPCLWMNFRKFGYFDIALDTDAWYFNYLVGSLVKIYLSVRDQHWSLKDSSFRCCSLFLLGLFSVSAEQSYIMQLKILQLQYFLQVDRLYWATNRKQCLIFTSLCINLACLWNYFYPGFAASFW